MRISDKEWKNIEFRKNKFRELESALDQAVSGRDNKVSSFLLGCLADGETGKAAAVEKLVNEPGKIHGQLWYKKQTVDRE